jgi:glyoxylase-like metal-dependent hydrolase (beta-lactamase superfamily II)
MVIKSFTVGPFAMNAYIIHMEDKKDSLLIDPGDELDVIENYLGANNLKPLAIVNTHAHIDHICFTSIIQEKYKLPFYLSAEEIPLLENLQQQGVMFGIETAPPPKVTHLLNEIDNLQIGDFSFKVIHAPGHSPGSMCFLFGDDLIGGDVLFSGSIGRTDLYKGNYQQLIGSIKTRLLTLPDKVRVYPGHGPATTIGDERYNNPFLV